jgi:hypothetical protein
MMQAVACAAPNAPNIASATPRTSSGAAMMYSESWNGLSTQFCATGGMAAGTPSTEVL